jgi:hypothetical protein
VALVAQRIEARGDDQRGRLAAQVAQDRRHARILLVGLPPQVLLRVPDHPVAGNDVAVLHLAVGRRAEREVGGGVDEHLTGGHGQARPRRELGHHRREIAAGGVAAHCHARRVHTQLAAVLADPSIGGETVLHRGGELGLRRQAIVDGHHDDPGAVGDARAEAVMRLEIALHPAAAVEVHQGGARAAAGHRVVDAGGDGARGARDLHVLDAREGGGRLVHQADHGAQLLAQLGQWWVDAGHADRLHELADELGLRVHGAAAQGDAVAGKEGEGGVFGHQGVGELELG